jgi:hypothetical protein
VRPIFFSCVLYHMKNCIHLSRCRTKRSIIFVVQERLFDDNRKWMRRSLSLSLLFSCDHTHIDCIRTKSEEETKSMISIVKSRCLRLIHESIGKRIRSVFPNNKYYPDLIICTHIHTWITAEVEEYEEEEGKEEEKENYALEKKISSYFSFVDNTHTHTHTHI